MIKIREARKDDLEELVKLHERLRGYHVRLDRYYYLTWPDVQTEGRKAIKTNLNDRRNVKVIVAEDDGKVVGFFTGKIKPSGGPNKTKIGKLSTAMVDKKYRGKGLGSGMFKIIYAWWRIRGVKHAQVLVYAGNPIGRSAWKKFGFKPFAMEMRLDI